MGSTRPNPSHVGWVESGRVGLDLCDESGLVEFFLPSMMSWVKKSLQPDPTRPMHTSTFHFYYTFF